jgi:cytochrome c oxidase subunit 2
MFTIQQINGANLMNSYMKKGSLLAMLCLVFIARSQAQDSPRTIEVHAKRYSFSPAEITIAKGEKVNLVLSTEDVAHSLSIPELHVDKEIEKGHPATVEVTSDKAGDFAGKCGRFCGSGHGSMRFVVHVKDN